MKEKSRRPATATPQVQSKKFFAHKNDTPIQTQSEPFFQAKLKVGQAGDQYEQEADAVADQVVHQSNSTDVQSKEMPGIQRYMTNAEEDEKGTNTERIEEDKAIQEKPELQRMGEQEEEGLQMMEQEPEEEGVQMMPEEEELQPE